MRNHALTSRTQAGRTLAAALALACLSLAGCRDHNEPVKPIAPSATASPANVTPGAAALGASQPG